jgi:recombinational DNA repair ATPase RecF
MINGLKKETQKFIIWHQRGCEYTNELKDNRNKQVNEIEKTFQDMKEEINKDKENLKNNSK